MGGAIGVDGREGQGSTFWFTAVFGMAPPGQSVPAGDPADRGFRAPAIESEARILVAEDNAINREVALAQLRKLGYKASAVTNGAEAIEALQRGRYDLVLMDCEMPVMDGYEATALIRGSGQPDLPVIALTAHSMQTDSDRCLSAGMNDFLAKPTDLKQLSGMLRKWLATTRQPTVDTSGAGERGPAPAQPAGEPAIRRRIGNRGGKVASDFGFVSAFRHRSFTVAAHMQSPTGCTQSSRGSSKLP